MNTFVISDTHFGHKNILSFKNEEGEHIRKFSSVEEMDDYMVTQWNSVVSHNDRVYHLGDFSFKKLDIADRLNGKIILIKGNHDLQKLSRYKKVFKDVRAYKTLYKNEAILSHIPIHPTCLERFGMNIHGHVHQNSLNDSRYVNVSVENINYTPVELDYILDLVPNLIKNEVCFCGQYKLTNTRNLDR